MPETHSLTPGEMELTDTSIMLASGALFDLANPGGSDFTLHDIAHGLGRVCRFAGQTNRFYSVAEHCVHVARILPVDLARAALLHDASEAFIGDVTRPLKRLLPDYRAIEREIEAAICDRFLAGAVPEGWNWREAIHDPAIKDADTALCMVEARELMPSAPGYWNLTVEPEMMARARGLRLNFDSPDYATRAWLRAWQRYGHLAEQNAERVAA